jgi:hypothetical protein
VYLVGQFARSVARAAEDNGTGTYTYTLGKESELAPGEAFAFDLVYQAGFVQAGSAVVTYGLGSVVSGVASNPVLAPTITASSITGLTASIAWTNGGLNGNSSSTSVVYRCDADGTNPVSVHTGASPASVSIPEGSQYYFTVGQSGNYNPARVYSAIIGPFPAGPPQPPTSASASSGNQRAVVSFTAPTNNNGSPVTSYKVYAASDTTFTTELATGASSPLTVTGLTNSTAYQFVVVALNAVGRSVASNTASVTPNPTVPDAPTGLSATTGNGSASVSFTAPANTGGEAITRYDVYSAENLTTSLGNTTAAPFSPIALTGLANDTLYQLVVRATNSVGQSAASSSVNATPSTPPPAAPTNVVSSVADGIAGITVNWNPPGGTSDTQAYYYKIICVEDNTQTVSIGPATTDSGLTFVVGTHIAAGTPYTFKVASSYNNLTFGTPSAATAATGVLAAPTNLRFTQLDQTQWAVSFTSVPDIKVGNTVINSAASYFNAGYGLSLNKSADDNGSGAFTYTFVRATGLTPPETAAIAVDCLALDTLGKKGVTSSAVTGTACNPVAAPTFSSAVANVSGGVVVSWTEGAAQGNTTTTTVVYRCAADGSSPVSAYTGASGGIVTGLTSGQSYYFVVGQRGNFNTAIVYSSVLGPIVPSTGGGASANLGVTNTGLVSWNIPTSLAAYVAAGSPISYTITYGGADTVHSVGSATQFQYTGLAAGQSYTFTFVARTTSPVASFTATCLLVNSTPTSALGSAISAGTTATAITNYFTSISTLVGAGTISASASATTALCDLLVATKAATTTTTLAEKAATEAAVNAAIRSQFTASDATKGVVVDGQGNVAITVQGGLGSNNTASLLASFDAVAPGFDTKKPYTRVVPGYTQVGSTNVYTASYTLTNADASAINGGTGYVGFSIPISVNGGNTYQLTVNRNAASVVLTYNGTNIVNGNGTVYQIGDFLTLGDVTYVFQAFGSASWGDGQTPTNPSNLVATVTGASVAFTWRSGDGTGTANQIDHFDVSVTPLGESALFTSSIPRAGFTKTAVPNTDYFNIVPTDANFLASVAALTAGTYTFSVKTYTALKNSGTVTSSSFTLNGEGGGGGDPYVTTFSNISYKLPALDAPIRYFQTMEGGKLLTINAQLKTVERSEMADDTLRSLLLLRNKMTAKQYSNIVEKLMQPETLCFFERISIQYGEQRLVVNLWDSKFELVENTLRCPVEKVDRPDLLKKAGGIYDGYKGETVKLKLGGTSVLLSVYDSPMIRNGISIESAALKNANGVVVNALSAGAMTLRSLASVDPVSTRNSLKAVSRVETFVDHDGVRSRNIVTYK